MVLISVGGLSVWLYKKPLHLKGIFKLSNKGFVYVMSNKSMPGLIKVGMSTKVPDERAKELSSDTSTPTPFIVEYYAFFDDMKKAERLTHQKLQNFHHAKEFFETDVAQAIQVIENLSITHTKIFSKPENDKKAKELQDKLNLQKKEEEQKKLLVEYALQKETLEKIIKEYPLKDGYFTNYSTKKILDNFKKLLMILANLNEYGGLTSKHREEVDNFADSIRKFEDIEKSQKSVLVDNRSEKEQKKDRKKFERELHLKTMITLMKWIGIILVVILIGAALGL